MDSFAFCGLSGCKPVALSGGGSGKGLGLKAAVGLASRCRNYPDDVKKGAGGAQPLPRSKAAPARSWWLTDRWPQDPGAISAFQRKKFGIGKADGVVDVGMRTDERLAGGQQHLRQSACRDDATHPARAVDHQYPRSTISAARTFKLNGGGGFVGFGEASWNKVVKHFQVDKFRLEQSARLA